MNARFLFTVFFGFLMSTMGPNAMDKNGMDQDEQERDPRKRFGIGQEPKEFEDFNTPKEWVQPRKSPDRKSPPPKVGSQRTVTATGRLAEKTEKLEGDTEVLKKTASDLREEVDRLRYELEKSREPVPFNPEENPVLDFRFIQLQHGLLSDEFDQSEVNREKKFPNRQPLRRQLKNVASKELLEWKEGLKAEKAQFKKAEKAEQSKLKKKFIDRHWEVVDGVIQPVSEQKLEHIIFVQWLKTKDMTPPYGSKIESIDVSCFRTMDPIKVFVGLGMLQRMILELQDETGFFREVLIRYTRDYMPRVSGVRASFSSWWSGETWVPDYRKDPAFSEVKEGLEGDYKRKDPWPAGRRFPRPQTDEAVALRALGKDNLGLYLEKNLFSKIKIVPPKVAEQLTFEELPQKKQEESGGEITVNERPHKTFEDFYRGFDEGHEIQEKGNAEIPWFKVTTHRIATFRIDGEEEIVSFVPKRKTFLRDEYPAVPILAFHRSLWKGVMDELLDQDRKPLKELYPKEKWEEMFGLYAKAVKQYQDLLIENIQALSPLLVSGFSAGMEPIPFRFTFCREPLVPEINRENLLKLSGHDLVDADLSRRRQFSKERRFCALWPYRRLGLPNNKLNFASVVPEQFDQLDQLDVSYNQITHPSVFNDFNFEVLDVSGNPFTDIQYLCQREPIGFDQSHEEVNAPILTKLRTLYLRRMGQAPNFLIDISPLGALSALHTLDISGNKITSLEGLKTLVNLEVLIATDNELKSVEGIWHLPRLSTVQISRNPLKLLGMDGGVSSLESLEAESCCLEGFWLKVFPVVCPALKNLALSGNELTWCEQEAALEDNDREFTLRFPQLDFIRVSEDKVLMKTLDQKQVCHPIKLSALAEKKTE